MKQVPPFLFLAAIVLLSVSAVSDLLFHLPHEVFVLDVAVGTICLLWDQASRRKRTRP